MQQMPRNSYFTDDDIFLFIVMKRFTFFAMRLFISMHFSVLTSNESGHLRVNKSVNISSLHEDDIKCCCVSVANQKIIHPEEVVMRPPEPESNMTDVSVYMDAIDAVKVPFLRTVPTKEGVTHDLAIKQPLDELGVNVRLHHPDGTIPDTLNTDR